MSRSPRVIEWICAVALALIALILVPGPAALAVVIVILLVLLGLSFLPALIRDRWRRRRAR